jgi:DNA replication ATP-dependent helicase Dna2
VYIDRKFDYCIIDEGSQIHFLLNLIPISRSTRFCIVGDHLQLKPLYKRAKNLELSLFEHLIKDCAVLSQQYRMGDNIMRLSNMMFYDNRLKGFGYPGNVKFIDSTELNYPIFIREIDKMISTDKSAENKVTILCYFNSQVAITQSYTKYLVTTIDRFQGSENDSIIVVFDPVEKCAVMESPERLNVALTRARKNLILVGNIKKMKEISLFNKLLEILD